MPDLDTGSLLKQLLYDPKNPLLFNNGFFVFFFTLFVILYYSFRNNFAVRRYIFCFFSLYFFYKASGYFVIWVIIAAVVNYVLSNAIHKQKENTNKKLLLVISIVINLSMLFWFKYTNFFIATCNNLFSTGFHPLNILLPIGISFYTFENLSYTVDVYQGKFEPAKNFSDYLLFLSFFPKLVMGPIVRASDFVPQVNQPYVISETDFAKGFYLIISGLFKKLVISDFITVNFVNYIFDAPSRYTGLENLFAVYGYAVVIYCDFSGYSDVAIGIARWLGFTIPANFASPYQSKSVTEFWKRWHISLSSWLRDYLYIPLGGNRSANWFSYLLAACLFAGTTAGLVSLLHLQWVWAASVSGGILLLFLLPGIIKKDRTAVAANFNLLNTMLLGGFWHGASWNFIIWGALHGIALAVHKIWMLLTGKTFKNINGSWWYKILAGLLTFHFVCFCWIFFKAPDFESGMDMLRQIKNDFSFNVWSGFYNNYKTVLAMMLMAFCIHIIPDDWADRVIEKTKRLPLVTYLLIFFAFVAVYAYFKSAEPVMPIYLQF